MLNLESRKEKERDLREDCECHESKRGVPYWEVSERKKVVVG